MRTFILLITFALFAPVLSAVSCQGKSYTSCKTGRAECGWSGCGCFTCKSTTHGCTDGCKAIGFWSDGTACKACTDISGCEHGRIECTTASNQKCLKCDSGKFPDGQVCKACDTTAATGQAGGDMTAAVGTSGVKTRTCTVAAAGSTDVTCDLENGFFKIAKANSANAGCGKCDTTAATGQAGGDMTAAVGTSGVKTRTCTVAAAGSTDVTCDVENGFFKIAKANSANAGCGSCASISQTCAEVNTACTKGVASESTPSKRCVRCEALSEAVDDTSRFCMTQCNKDSWFVNNSDQCRRYQAKGTDTPQGCGARGDACYAKLIGAYEYTDPADQHKTCRPCKDYVAGKLTACLTCSETKCLTGTCTGGSLQTSGTCKDDAAGGGGSGGGGGNNTNKTNSTDNSTGSIVAASFAGIIVALSLLV